MSSPKAKSAKAKDKAKDMAKRSKSAIAKSAPEEPTRAEKAAFVKAMLHGIEPGTKAAEVMAKKKAGGKKADAKASSKTAAKSKKAAKDSGKKNAKSKDKPVRQAPKQAPFTTPVVDVVSDEAPKVEILRRISAPEPVVSSPKSDEIIKLAKEIEKALEDGNLDFVQPHAVQALMMALCKFYAANDENDNTYPILPGRLAISGTDAMVVCGALLRAVDLQVFELGMFQSWSGR